MNIRFNLLDPSKVVKSSFIYTYTIEF